MNLYDCLFGKGRPWKPCEPFPGMKPVLVDGQRFYAVKPNTGGARDLSRFDPAEAAKWPKLCPRALVVADIESRHDDDEHRELHTDVRLYPGRAVDADLEFVNRIINAVRSGITDQSVGLYGTLPTGYNVFNAVLLKDWTELKRACAANDYIAAQIGENLDALHPSLYVNSKDESAWVQFAAWQVQECRRIARAVHMAYPIIPFISPEIHPSAGGGLIPMTFWKKQIRTLMELGCDGAVLWCSQDHPADSMVPYASAAVVTVGTERSGD